MPNKNYVKGVKKERKVMKYYDMQGSTTLRTAGSHGFADVIAIDPVYKIIKFIQCKPDNYSDSATKKLLEENKHFNGTYKVIFKVL